MPAFPRSTLVPFALACMLSACSGSDGGANPGGSPNAGSGGAGGAGGAGGSGGGDTLPGFYVNDRFLYDKCGNKVILRGINEMIVWSSGKDGDPEYAEIAKTGANVVRIVWNKSGAASALAIANALEQKLIPMVENHDATGDITKVPAAVDYWVKEDVVAVLKKYEDKVLLNIANEAGDTACTAEDYEATYKDAIARLRDVGYKMPIVIDSSSWGTDVNRLQESGPALIEADPLKNILLSAHAYWNDTTGTGAEQRLQAMADKGLPFIVGEVADTSAGTCKPGSFNVTAFMDVAQRLEVGWLAWSWGGVPNNDCKDKDTGVGMFDMTSDGTFDGLQGWGKVMATDDPNSIKNTAVLAPYIATGTCD